MSEPAGTPGTCAPRGGAVAEWRRLDRRTVLVTAFVMAGVAAGAGLPTALGLAGGMPLWQAFGWVLAGAVLLIAARHAARTTSGGAAPATASAPSAPNSTPDCCWSNAVRWPANGSAAST